MRSSRLFVLLVCLLAAGSIYALVPRQVEEDKRELTLELASGDKVMLQLEIATTPEAIQKGLMFRTSLPDAQGMLFAFSPAREVSFWMKNTLIPLDMLFIRPDGVIHKVHANAQPNDLTAIPSEVPVSAVIELAGGQAAKLGITPGSRIDPAALPQPAPN